jgi:hypothetical protein
MWLPEVCLILAIRRRYSRCGHYDPLGIIARGNDQPLTIQPPIALVPDDPSVIDLFRLFGAKEMNDRRRWLPSYLLLCGAWSETTIRNDDPTRSICQDCFKVKHAPLLREQYAKPIIIQSVEGPVTLTHVRDERNQAGLVGPVWRVDQVRKCWHLTTVLN